MLTQLLADGALIAILATAGPVILYELRRSFWSNSPVVIMAGLTSLLVGKILSLLYQPAVARPFIEMGVEPGAAYIDNPGFPSDHALLATVIVVAVYALSRRPTMTLVLTLVVIAMSVGRVLALVHTPLDIVGGIVAGLAGAAWYMKLTKLSKPVII